jgi:hypothetical protein
MIGPPGETMDFPRLQQTAWDYRFQDTGATRDLVGDVRPQGSSPQ